MFQQLLLVGNLGSDPQLRDVNGTPVASFSLATNERWRDRDGNQQEKTTWWRVSAWGKTAENVNAYLSKGRQVMVLGTLESGDDGGPKTWTDQQGAVRASFDVRASKVQFLAGGASDSSQASGASNAGDDAGIPF